MDRDQDARNTPGSGNHTPWTNCCMNTHIMSRGRKNLSQTACTSSPTMTGRDRFGTSLRTTLLKMLCCARRHSFLKLVAVGPSQTFQTFPACALFVRVPLRAHSIPHPRGQIVQLGIILPHPGPLVLFPS